jgi:hypothetical protein
MTAMRASYLGIPEDTAQFVAIRESESNRNGIPEDTAEFVAIRRECKIRIAMEFQRTGY